MLPFTTTTVRIERWSPTNLGHRDVLQDGLPAVVSGITGRLIAAYRGAGEGAWYEDASAMLNLSDFKVNENDIVTDLGTYERFRVQWAKVRQGLGLNHVEGGLETYLTTGQYSIMRGHTVDSFGDQVPTLTPIYQNLEGEVREISRASQQSTTDSPSTVSSLSGRFPPYLHIKVGDQVLNQLTGDIYSVTSVGLVTSSLSSDTDCELVKNR